MPVRFGPHPLLELPPFKRWSISKQLYHNLIHFGPHPLLESPFAIIQASFLSLPLTPLGFASHADLFLQFATALSLGLPHSIATSLFQNFFVWTPTSLSLLYSSSTFHLSHLALCIYCISYILRTRMVKAKRNSGTPSPIFLNPSDDTSLKNSENLTLVSKVVSNQFIPCGVVKRAVNRSWGLRENAEVQPIKFNVFLIKFQNEEDKDKAWSFRPWSVQGYHLLLQPWKEDVAVERMLLDRIVFWVQVHGLPTAFISEENAVKIGKRLGKIEFFDIHNAGGVPTRLRLRVQWDVRKPLMLGLPMPRKDQPDDWIFFKYEKLGEFCFKCGRLGHETKGCKEKKPGEIINVRTVNLKKFGPWLCAEPTKGRRQQDFISIPPEREEVSFGTRNQKDQGGDCAGGAESSNQAGFRGEDRQDCSRSTPFVQTSKENFGETYVEKKSYEFDGNGNMEKESCFSEKVFEKVAKNRKSCKPLDRRSIPSDHQSCDEHLGISSKKRRGVNQEIDGECVSNYSKKQKTYCVSENQGEIHAGESQRDQHLGSQLPLEDSGPNNTGKVPDGRSLVSPKDNMTQQGNLCAPNGVNDNIEKVMSTLHLANKTQESSSDVSVNHGIDDNLEDVDLDLEDFGPLEEGYEDEQFVEKEAFMDTSLVEIPIDNELVTEFEKPKNPSARRKQSKQSSVARNVDNIILDSSLDPVESRGTADKQTLKSK